MVSLAATVKMGYVELATDTVGTEIKMGLGLQELGGVGIGQGGIADMTGLKQR
jgi:hypothetical protein